MDSHDLIPPMMLRGGGGGKPAPKAPLIIAAAIIIVWFALAEDRPLFAFAGIWRPWTGTRGPKSAPVEGEHLLFSFLTCEPNAIVAPIHPKAMPVILTTPAEWQTWLTAPTPEALALQRPLPDDALRIVAKGERSDGEVTANPTPVAGNGAVTELLNDAKGG